MGVINRKKNIMPKHAVATSIAAGFFAITLAQGVAYPAIALGDEMPSNEPSATQQVDATTQGPAKNANEQNVETVEQEPTPSPVPAPTPTPQAPQQSATTPDAVAQDGTYINVQSGASSDDSTPSAYADNAQQPTIPPEPTEPSKPEQPKNGWVEETVNGATVRHWYDHGVMARSKEVYDPAANAWLWFDADGTQAKDKDVYMPKADKWVRYDVTGRMVKGREDRKDGGWYYFDATTGAMAKGMTYLKKGNKWVYYDPTTGRMQYGAHMVNGRHLYFDPVTGRQWSGDEIINKVLATARSSYGKNIDAAGALRNAGGLLCPWGPCTEWIWWVFNQAGLSLFFSDGATSGWPHHNFDWYRARGRVSMTPHVGDIAFYRFSPASSTWARDKSASHAGIVVRVERGAVWIADAAYSSIAERNATRVYGGGLVGYARPYYFG